MLCFCRRHLHQRSQAGNIHIANFGNYSIRVFAAGPVGNVAPTATISGGNTSLNGPDDVAEDAAGKLYVANATDNSITVYSAGATGNASPIATIEGGSTRIDNPTGLALQP